MEYCQTSVWLTLQEVRDLVELGQAIIGDHFYQELEERLQTRMAIRSQGLLG